MDGFMVILALILNMLDFLKHELHNQHLITIHLDNRSHSVMFYRDWINFYTEQRMGVD